MAEPSDDDSLHNPFRKKLFNKAMNHNWESVMVLYKKQEVQGVPITRANDTLLHVAVSSAPEKIVLQLLDIVHGLNTKDQMAEIFNKKNKTGDTPLHLAAAIGLEKVCRKIAELCPDMVTSERNHLQETPLLRAVRHRNKNAFFVLEVAIHKNQNLKIDEKYRLEMRDVNHCIGHDGNNILHYAIKGEQFDMAYEIIHLYPVLVNYVNSSGETALHTLANKPSLFKSGARAHHFGLCDAIIYHCTITEPLKYHFVNYMKKETTGTNDEQQDISQEDKNKVMPIYKVYIDLYSLMKDSISWINTNASSSEPVAASSSETAEAQKELRRPYPKNYDTMILFFTMIIKLLIVVLGIGLKRLQTIRKIKEQHRNAKKIMNELVNYSTLWEYEEASGGKDQDINVSSLTSEEIKSPPSVEITPNPSEGHLHYSIEDSLQFLIKAVKEVRIDMDEEKESMNRSYTESPVLVAAKKGITEIVKQILKKYPVAIFDQDKDAKNIVLLAAEHRQVHVYYMLMNISTSESVFWKLDKEGNSALHLAAKLSDSRLWGTGAALHIQWEIKWYKFVRSSMPIMGGGRSITENNAGKMPEEVFIESHGALIKEGISALTNTCQSCSVVAALFATVAFQSVSTVPGGVDQQSGIPIFSKRPVFHLITISSLLALCSSVTSVVMFLAILISDFKIWDFERRLPMKLILGLTSLFMAIASTLVAFCAGDFYVIESNLEFAAYPIYAIMCFPVTYFAIAQYPLYSSLIKQTIKKKVPKPEMVQDHST